MSARPRAVVADDDPDILDLVAFRLERCGLAALPAHDGEEALALIRGHGPALAVLDVMMPRLDGLSLTRILRADPATRALPIVLLTARSQDADLRAGLDADADAYLRKPFSAQELGERVAALLSAPPEPVHAG
jgi:DNA-binding response OmpR family regulator